MIPDADIVAFSTSVSNHWSRKSTALMVSNWTWLTLSWERMSRKRLPMPSSSSRPRGSREVGSGGNMPMIGLANRPISTMALPYSS